MSRQTAEIARNDKIKSIRCYLWNILLFFEKGHLLAVSSIYTHVRVDLWPGLFRVYKEIKPPN